MGTYSRIDSPECVWPFKCAGRVTGKKKKGERVYLAFNNAEATQLWKSRVALYNTSIYY